MLSVRVPRRCIDVVKEKGREIVYNILFDDGTERTDVPRNEVTHVFLFFAVHNFYQKSCPEPSFLSFPGDID